MSPLLASVALWVSVSFLFGYGVASTGLQSAGAVAGLAGALAVTFLNPGA